METPRMHARTRSQARTHARASTHARTHAHTHTHTHTHGHTHTHTHGHYMGYASAHASRIQHHELYTVNLRLVTSRAICDLFFSFFIIGTHISLTNIFSVNRATKPNRGCFTLVCFC